MKHALPINWIAIDQKEPKHVVETLTARWYADDFNNGLHSNTPYTPGRHAKPFGKHHPATPVTYDRAGNTTPLATVTPNLDVAA